MDVSIIRTKPTPRKTPPRPGNSHFAFFRNLTNRCYRDPYTWSLIKCTLFFAGSVLAAKALSDLDILPVEPPSQPSTPSAY